MPTHTHEYHPLRGTNGSLDSGSLESSSAEVLGIVNSTAFRSLSGKTQLVPTPFNLGLRNRRTHSWEVRSIALGIATRITAETDIYVDFASTEAATLAHDIGHPPFGHVAERVLDEFLRTDGGFESNAQSAHMLVSGDFPLRDRTLAAAVKYRRSIPQSRPPGSPLEKGVYAADQPLFTGLWEEFPGETVEAQIVNLADDIGNAIFDIHDVVAFHGESQFRALFEKQFNVDELADSILNVDARVTSEEGRETVPAALSEMWDVLIPGVFSEPGSTAYERLGAYLQSWVTSVQVMGTTEHARLVLPDELHIKIEVLRAVVRTTFLNTAANIGFDDMIKRSVEQAYVLLCNATTRQLEEISAAYHVDFPNESASRARDAVQIIQQMTDLNLLSIASLSSSSIHPYYRTKGSIVTGQLQDTAEQFSVYSDTYATERYSIYKKLRSVEPVFWHEETQSWFITRYEDVSKLLVGDKFITSSLITNKMKNVPVGEQGHFRDIIDIISTWMIYNDRPVHSRLRKHMNRAFWSSEVELIRPEIKDIVSGNLERILREQGTIFDFVSEIAHPIPALVLCKMLGIPGSEVDRFIKWSDDIAAFMQNFVVSPAPDRDISEHTRKSMTEMHNFLFEAIRERRRAPQNDLLTRLISTGDGTKDQLADIELVRQTIHLIFGGHKIPQFLLSNCLHLFFQNPAEFAQVKENDALLPAAIEECIRLEGPIQYITRHAAADIEIHGKSIKKDDSVYFFLGAAGRDESTFPDTEKFRLDRTGAKPLAFGGGYHACIAGAFARMEVEEVLREFVDRIPDVKPSYDLDRPQWTANPTFHGLLTMPVEVPR